MTIEELRVAEGLCEELGTADELWNDADELRDELEGLEELCHDEELRDRLDGAEELWDEIGEAEDMRGQRAVGQA